jgi:ribosome-associated translation inhibitor RaiA
MRLKLTTQGVELTPDLRERVWRRIHFALGRFSAGIKSVSVRLTDVNGPRGGVDKCCVVSIQPVMCPAVVIREQHNDVHAAVAIAAERAGRCITRQLHLHRQLQVRRARDGSVRPGDSAVCSADADLQSGRG